MTTMFIEAIEFLNNVGDIHKALNNVKENNVEPSKLIQDVVKYWKLFTDTEDKISLNMLTLSNLFFRQCAQKL